MTAYLRAFLVSVALVFAALPSRAVVLTASLTGTDFGNLDQHDTLCGNVACGPTAAVNSFEFLQNTYPTIYGNKLIPHTGGNTHYDDLVDAANVLGSSTYMNSCDLCNPAGGGGTFIEEFIVGKRKYLESVVPGQTVYLAMNTLAWREVTPDGVNNGPKPDFVQDNTAPTLEFLYNEIKHGEDVELFINFTGGNHYITLTAITFDTELLTGSIEFVDPDDGELATATILGLDPADNDILLGNYLPNANIVNAVSESPIPEPATIVLLMIGVTALVILRRRRSV